VICAVAIETRWPWWVHAFDLDQDRLLHPLNAEYEIRPDLDWRTALEAPRCQHCLEIVGQYRRTERLSDEH
jgi:hypothetical protein